MPSRNFNEINVEANRAEDFRYEIYDLADLPLVIDALDKVHFKLAQTRGGLEALELVSGVVTANGSTVLIDSLGAADPPSPAKGRVRLGAADTEPLSGKYFVSMDLEDLSETNPNNRFKPFLRGSLFFNPNQDP